MFSTRLQVSYRRYVIGHFDISPTELNQRWAALKAKWNKIKI